MSELVAALLLCSELAVSLSSEWADCSAPVSGLVAALLLSSEFAVSSEVAALVLGLVSELREALLVSSA